MLRQTGYRFSEIAVLFYTSMNNGARCEPLKCTTEQTMSFVKLPGLQPKDIRLYFMVQLEECDGGVFFEFSIVEKKKRKKEKQENN